MWSPRHLRGRHDCEIGDEGKYVVGLGILCPSTHRRDPVRKARLESNSTRRRHRHWSPTLRFGISELLVATGDSNLGLDEVSKVRRNPHGHDAFLHDDLFVRLIPGIEKEIIREQLRERLKAG